MNLTTSLLLTLCIVCLGAIVAQLRRNLESSQSKLRRRFYWPSEKALYAREYYEDRTKYDSWLNDHPFGPLSLEEKEEQDILIANVVCSKMLHCDSLNLPFLDEHTAELNDRTND